jgi:hypothetical protein
MSTYRWQRWNPTKKIFEKSYDAGATWTPIELDLSDTAISISTVDEGGTGTDVQVTHGINFFNGSIITSSNGLTFDGSKTVALTSALTETGIKLVGAGSPGVAASYISLRDTVTGTLFSIQNKDGQLVFNDGVFDRAIIDSTGLYSPQVSATLFSGVNLSLTGTSFFGDMLTVNSNIRMVGQMISGTIPVLITDAAGYLIAAALTGTLLAAQFPVLSGAITTPGGSLVTTLTPFASTFLTDTAVIVRTSGSYADPAWITSLAASKITGTLLAIQGGTGQNTYAVGDLLVGGAANTLSKLPAVAVGSVLTSAGVGVAPVWAAPSGSSGVTSITGTANQVIVAGTGGPAFTGAIILSLPQSIATTSTPTFASLTLTTLAVGSSSVFTGGVTLRNELLIDSQGAGGDKLTLGGVTQAVASERIILRGGSAWNAWQMAVGTPGNNYFQITPSTAVGGLTFSTATITMDPAGNVGIGATPDGQLTTTYKNYTVIGSWAESTFSSKNNGSVNNINQWTMGFPAGTYGAISIGYITTSGAGNTKGSIFFATRDVTTDTAPTVRMTITPAGNVGVGTTGPLLGLIAGAGTSAMESATSTPNGFFGVGNDGVTGVGLTMGVYGAGGVSWIQSRNWASTTTYGLLLNPSGGAVSVNYTAATSSPFGIKSNTSGDALALVGRTSGDISTITFRNAGDSSTLAQIINDSALGLSLVTTTAVPLLFKINSVLKLTVDVARISFAIPMSLKAYTVATLPAGTIGDMAYVTDGALGLGFRTIVTGGGTGKYVVFYDGTNWVNI